MNVCEGKCVMGIGQSEANFCLQLEDQNDLNSDVVHVVH